MARTLAGAPSSPGYGPGMQSSFEDLLVDGPVVLDGAMGTELDSRGVDTRHSLWSALAPLEAPDVVAAVHRDYLAAGARVLTTASYQMSGPAFESAGRTAAEARAAVAASARIALAVARDHGREHPGDRVAVVGGLGPYGAFLADGSEYTGDYEATVSELEAVHAPRIEVLAAEGLTDFALETVPRLDEAEAVVAMLGKTVPGARCWVSFQLRADGDRLADGTPLERAAAWADREERVIAVGTNCVAPSTVTPALAMLRAATRKPLLAYPNSGDSYDPVTKTWSLAPAAERFTAYAGEWLDAGVRLLGGCCRTTPRDTGALADAVGRWRAARH